MAFDTPIQNVRVAYGGGAGAENLGLRVVHGGGEFVIPQLTG